MSTVPGFDPYSPAEIAQRIEDVGVTKARMAPPRLFVLGVVAGGFIGLASMFYTIVTADGTLGFSAGRLVGGLVFSMGLLMVVVAGAELFTGNNLMVVAWADGRLRLAEVLRNWAIVCVANFVGAAGLAALVWLSGHPTLGGGAIAKQALAIAHAKVALDPLQALVRGVLCNVLVCLAVWMAMAGRSVTDRFVAVLLPVAAFVAAGFEHSIANMYLIPLAMLIEAGAPGAITVSQMLANLVPVIAGNVLGGGGLVAGVYFVVYRWGQPRPPAG